MKLADIKLIAEDIKNYTEGRPGFMYKDILLQKANDALQCLLNEKVHEA